MTVLSGRTVWLGQAGNDLPPMVPTTNVELPAKPNNVERDAANGHHVFQRTANH